MADFINRIKNKKRSDRNSIYSMVSSSDLTPGSLEIWLDLPDEIKFDPSLEPFKKKYEQQHGKLGTPEVLITDEAEKSLFDKKIPTVEENVEQNNENMLRDCGNRLMEHSPVEEEKEIKSETARKFQFILRVVKLSTLVACWMLLTVSLIMNREKSNVVLHTAVKGGEIKEYELRTTLDRLLVSVTITGPFRQNLSNDTSNILQLWLHRESDILDIEQNSRLWLVNLQPEDLLDFSPSTSETKTLVLEKSRYSRNTTSDGNDTWIIDSLWDQVDNNDTKVTLRMFTSSNSTVPLTVSYQMNTLEERDGLIYSTVLLCTLYFLIIFESKSRGVPTKTQRYPSHRMMHGIGPEYTALFAPISAHPEKGRSFCELGVHLRDIRDAPPPGRGGGKQCSTRRLTDSSCTLNLRTHIMILLDLHITVVNRTIAALLSSSLAIAVLALSGARPSLPELISWLDVETLLLLFSMMILVAILAETGVFDYLAVVAFEVTGGRTWPLMNCLCFFTAFFSTFLDNVTTVLLMTPVTIRLCEVMHLNPVPVLMSMVIFSNVGGAATPVGDPPNVIIASHPSMLAQNINFTSFTFHMGLGILLVCVQTYLQLRFMFRDISKLRHSVPRDILEAVGYDCVYSHKHPPFYTGAAWCVIDILLRGEQTMGKAYASAVGILVVVERLNSVLVRREAGGGTSRTDPKFCSTLAQMKEKYQIRDKQLLVKSAVCVMFVVVVFFLHAIPELQRLSLGWTALLGALLLLLLAEREDLEPILARVEWSTLLFFAALFVLMEALSKLGLIAWIGNMTEAVILQVNQESRLAVAIMLVLWVSGLASAFVDNIPLTTMMVRVIAALADPAGLNLPLAPLAWALSFGACLGGKCYFSLTNLIEPADFHFLGKHIPS
ncbi:unnamed protein product [Diatraea saccharalis]|uniref:Citrate transporter-like domain-containing protein n=1 Tax=Diatraea saccharalis TaxID=40085 RepID=A0A9N9RDH9_9NEOP|nr:unnamed protein product [Diatraea saccharalis]